MDGQDDPVDALAGSGAAAGANEYGVLHLLALSSGGGGAPGGGRAPATPPRTMISSRAFEDWGAQCTPMAAALLHAAALP